MHSNRFSKYTFILCPLSILFVFGMLVLDTYTVHTSIVLPGERNQEGNGSRSKEMIQGYYAITEDLYLPLVQRNAVLPQVPTLYDIENADGNGSYTINWSTSSLATNFTLEEDDNSNFSSPTAVYSGPATTHTITGKGIGTYYYRVRAENGMGSSGWSVVKIANVTNVSELKCETHNFGTGGVAWPIQSSGRTEHFAAENTMIVETVEVKSVLKALFPINVYVAVGINGDTLANKTHYVFSNAYTPYYINKSVTAGLAAGDDISYYISKAAGDTEAWIAWGNYVKLCGR